LLSLFGFTRLSSDLTVGRRADDAELGRRAAADHACPLIHLDDDRLARQEFRIGIVGAEHQKQIAVHDGVIVRLRSNHADPTHPARVVIWHDVLAFDGMDQWRLEPIGEPAQFLGRAVTSNAAHDYDAAGFVDAAGDLHNICFAGGDFRSRLERGDAGNAAVGPRADDVLWQRQMRDAGACISGGDGLMDDGRRLCRRGNGLGIERDITEQQVGLCRLKIVGALHLARHVAGERKNRRVVAARLIEAGDKVRAARPGCSATDAEPTGSFAFREGGGSLRRCLQVRFPDPAIYLPTSFRSASLILSCQLGTAS
jgi:hypothetical protein